MTTDKKHSIAERLKALRDQVAGVIAAAEEEEPSVAETVLPVKVDAAAEEQPSGETPKHHRASDDEIASALRKFTWELAPEEMEEAEPQRASAVSSVANPPVSPSGDKDILEQFLSEHDDDNDGQNSGESETNAVEDHLTPGSEAPSEEPAATEHEMGEAAGISEQKQDGLPTPEAESGLVPTAAESEPVGERADKTTAFAGLAEVLARLKMESAGEAAERATEEVPDSGSEPLVPDADEPEDMFTDSNEKPPEPENIEPEPEDVAKLWEPRQGKHQNSDANSQSRDDPALDPSREETHVFTDEDLKNLPKKQDTEDEGDEVAAEPDEEDEYEDEEGYTPRDFRPIRRRRYYRSGIVGGIMYFLFVICVSVTLAAFAWLAADDALSLNKEYIEAEVYVGEDMDVSQIATELHTKGLIRYKKLFALFGKFFHADEKIEPGTYTLSTKLDYRALIQNMHHYTGWTGEARATVKVTIPEGKTVMETFQILAEHGVCPYETLMECAATETFDYSFLKDIPDGDATRLEGYLFPDTYEFYADSSPKAAICRFLDNFGERIPERVEELAAANGYTLRETIIIASLIEKEAGSDTERATIASVIYNRLQSTSYPFLQIDATIQYAMGEHKESLTYEDLEVDSPYNTYLYPGLPPGPIANPGLASIRAALNPESTGYYFYALHKNGNHKFFSSYNEFQRFINSSDYGG